NDRFCHCAAGPTLAGHEGAEAWLDLPKLALRLVDGATRSEFCGPLESGTMIRAEPSGTRRRTDRLDAAPDLAARPGLFVDDADRKAKTARSHGSSHTGRPRADDQQVCIVAAHAGRLLRPSCRPMLMPSRTGIRQPCTEPSPSTSTRHSKHT